MAVLVVVLPTSMFVTPACLFRHVHKVGHFYSHKEADYSPIIHGYGLEWDIPTNTTHQPSNKWEWNNREQFLPRYNLPNILLCDKKKMMMVLGVMESRLMMMMMTSHLWQ
jgi:hypothetical protein